ncbi:MAG: hypothetical protein ACOYNL_10080 [Rickettsiales bacterium]
MSFINPKAAHLKDELKPEQYGRPPQHTGPRLADLLTCEQIRKLYSDPNNGFGSLAIDNSARQLVTAWGKIQMAEGDFTQRYEFCEQVRERLAATDYTPGRRITPMLEAMLNEHARRKGPQLADALIYMRDNGQISITNEQIAALPHATNPITGSRYLDDSIGSDRRSGAATIIDYIYKPMIPNLEPGKYFQGHVR